MGRALLLIAAALAATAGCQPAGSGADIASGHQALSCAVCHRGGLVDRDVAPVPPETCTSSRCHGSEIPQDVMLETVRFQHRGHGSTESLAVGCAGCHSHDEGSESIAATHETCGLCHQEELAESRGDACRKCHGQPTHAGITPEGLVIPHAGLPWIERGCVRCHYEVDQPVQDIEIEKCADCHADVRAVREAGTGTDLHPEHVSVSCASCHEVDTHRIESMSSAVELRCADCHAVEHDVDVDHGWLEPRTCLSCHRSAHVEAQAMFLGIPPAGVVATPSGHFMAGLSCRSCHDESDADRTGTGSESGDACLACHRSEYRVIPRWWRDGVEARLQIAERYLRVSGADAARLPVDHPARIAVETARDRLVWVRAGYGVHNLPLTHQLLQEAVRAGADVYPALGAATPRPPALGRAPRSGFCSFCHYQIGDLGLTENMPEDFHREVIGG